MCLIPLALSTSSGVRPDVSAMRLAAAVGMLPTVQLCWHLNGVSPSSAAEHMLQLTASQLAGAPNGDSATDEQVAAALRRGALFAPIDEDKPLALATTVAGGTKAASSSAALAIVARSLHRVAAPKAAPLQHWVACAVTVASTVQVSDEGAPLQWSCVGLCPLPVGSGSNWLDVEQTLGSLQHAAVLHNQQGTPSPSTSHLNGPPRRFMMGAELTSPSVWDELLPWSPRQCSSGAPATDEAVAPSTAHISLAYTVDVHCLSTRNASLVAHRLDPLLSAGMTLARPSALHRSSALPHAMRSNKGHWAAQRHMRQRVVWHFWGDSGDAHCTDTRHSMHCAVCGVHTGDAQGMAVHCRCTHEHLHVAVYEQAWHSEQQPLVAGAGNVGTTAPLRTLHVHVTPAYDALTVQPSTPDTTLASPWDNAGAWLVQAASSPARKRSQAQAAPSSSARKRARKLAAGEAQRPDHTHSRVQSPVGLDLFRVPDCVLPRSVLPPSQEEASTAVLAASLLMQENAPILVPDDAAGDNGDEAEAAPGTPVSDSAGSDAAATDVAGAAIARQFVFTARCDASTPSQMALKQRRATAAAVWGLRGIAPLPQAAHSEQAMQHLRAYSEQDEQGKAQHGTEIDASSFSRWARAAVRARVSAAAPQGAAEAVAAVQAAVAGGCPPALATKAGAASRRSRAAQGGSADTGPFGAALGVRQYFHSRTGQPVRQWEASEDSDEEVDSSWMVKVSERQLDDFEDVSVEEKELMKLWNRHVHDYGVVTDRLVPRAVVSFARVHGPLLLLRGLRHTFLLHLTTLWDFAVLDSRSILHAMRILDAYALAMGIKPGAEGYRQVVHVATQDTRPGTASAAAAAAAVMPASGSHRHE